MTERALLIFHRHICIRLAGFQTLQYADSSARSGKFKCLEIFIGRHVSSLVTLIGINEVSKKNIFLISGILSHIDK